MTDKLAIYSVVINWNDNDSEQGDYGTVVLARNATEAERLARLDMREAYITSECENDDDADKIAARVAAHTHGGEFGDSLASCDRGAIWKAAELEDALRNLLAIVGMPNAATRPEIAEARALLANIEKSAVTPVDHASNPFDPESPEGRAWDRGDRSSVTP